MTSKLTREQLHERARENVKALKMASRQHAFESAREEILADLQLAELALAVMDSEPVAYTDEEELNFVNDMACMWTKGMGINEVPLYRHAQPAPVVSEDLYKLANHIASSKSGLPDEWLDWAEELETDIRRAAVLQAGNSPVIPDGYVMVPKEMTDEIGEAIAMQANCCGGIALDIYDAMLAAAPHDTPALNSLQSVDSVTGGWIPVSERMPDDDDFVYIWPRPDFGVELHVGQYCERSHKGGGWYAQVYEQNYGIEWHSITVTHWTPLPAAPQEVK
ncbi:DUF551 domain-containing protein [Raoultella ornithinolytica]|uniref:DUF551 domain-containing protein n=1 Tax=Raoultella ornithinolytica TaxID=54291 RepID=UPI003AAB628E